MLFKIFRYYERPRLTENPSEIMAVLKSRHKDPVSRVCRQWHSIWKVSFRLPKSILILPSCELGNYGADRAEGGVCKGSTCEFLTLVVQRHNPQYKRVTTVVIEECPHAKMLNLSEAFERYLYRIGILAVQLRRISTLTNIHIAPENRPLAFENLTHYQVTSCVYGQGMKYGKIPPVKNITISANPAVGFALMGRNRVLWGQIRRFDINEYDHDVAWSILKPVFQDMKCLAEFSLCLANPNLEQYKVILNGLSKSCERIEFWDMLFKDRSQLQKTQCISGLKRSDNIFQGFKQLRTLCAPGSLLAAATEFCSLPTSLESVTASRSNLGLQKLLQTRFEMRTETFSINFVDRRRVRCACEGELCAWKGWTGKCRPR
ncbi:hypothetical protein TWF788_008258 [Orbilia oligospora]|uniref:Uncharacterized protein n=1 Tax=Orbilia oligospora TaxID=2813651 RepID=A0A7C8Q3F1_ORBOL|nr:hypothetical protein TWF788_008258 [Orbilia oligospora]